MRRLICAKDIEALILNGEKVFHLEGSEIITPSAQDLARINGIVFTTESPKVKVQEVNNVSVANVDKCETTKFPSLENMDNEMLMNLFKAMLDKGLLQQMLQCLQGDKLPYDAECSENGFKVVRGKTVQMDFFDTGNPDANVHYQELVGEKDSHMRAGFLTIEKSKFNWELTDYEEINYVIDGTLTIEIDGKTYIAHAGDVLFVPMGSKVVWGSPDKAKVFYTTFPMEV